jgi:large subunit ribosomal protein L9
MAMEVLLRRTIDGVGEVGEVVKVRNGYARNYLLPRGFAAIVSPDSLLRVKQDRVEEGTRQALLAKERAALAERLTGLTLTIEARAGEDGHLYGSVGPRQVLAAFASAGFDIPERQFRFEPVRELGQHECEVALGEDKRIPVAIWVVQDAAEAREMAAEAEQRAAEGPEASAAE